jgi:hypothetical protein
MIEYCPCECHEEGLDCPECLRSVSVYAGDGVWVCDCGATYECENCNGWHWEDNSGEENSQ